MLFSILCHKIFFLVTFLQAQFSLINILALARISLVGIMKKRMGLFILIRHQIKSTSEKYTLFVRR